MFNTSSRFVFPKLKQCNLPTGRVYKVAEGEYAGKVYPSITRILGHRPKPFLEQWKARVGTEEAARISQLATTRGTSLHKLVEEYLSNDIKTPYNAVVAELWVRLRAWLDEHITLVHGQECDVFSEHLGAAGRFDLCADVDHVTSVVDFKQALKAKREDWIEDYYLQGTFYACAIFERTGIPVKQIVVPIVNPDGLQVFVTKPGKHFSALCERVEEFHVAQLDTPTPVEV